MAYYYSNGERRVHSVVFPPNFRALLVGESGSGKTTFLMNILLGDNLLNYDKLYIYARTLYQPEYQVLEAGLRYNLTKRNIVKLLGSEEFSIRNNLTIDETAQLLKKYQDANVNEIPSNIEFEFSSDPTNIPDPSELNKQKRNLIIFDDILCNRTQTTAENYYTRGRSANCDSIYLSQNYTRLPLHTIRSNTNFMVFFKSSPIVVEQLWRNYSSVDCKLKDWKKFCNDSWKNPYGYIVIDKSRTFESGNKYRKSLALNC